MRPGSGYGAKGRSFLLDPPARRLRRARGDPRASFKRARSASKANGTLEQNNIRAAVLVPLVERADGWFVVLTLRSADLADHAGQISLPGGASRRRISIRRGRYAARSRGRDRPVARLCRARRAARYLAHRHRFRGDTRRRAGRRPPPPYRAPTRSRSPEVFEVPLAFISRQAQSPMALARACHAASSVFSGRSVYLGTATSGARRPACWSISPTR